VLAQSDIYSRVNVVTSGTSDYNEIVTIAGSNGGWSAEAGSRSQSNAPNYRKVTPTHGELYALPRVSNWALNDLQHDVLSIVNQDVADTFAISISTAIHAGNGSSQPTGMTNSAPTNANDYASPMRAAAVYEYVATGSSPTSTGLTVDDCIDLQTTLRRPYRNGAEFAVNRTTLGVIRKLKDSYGQYLWQPSTQAGMPDVFLGDPVFVWEDMADDGSANALPVAYGNFRRAYTFIKIGGMTMIQDNVTVPGFTNFYTAQRAGGIPRNNDAVKFLKLAAS
jgi:HK97 family phage major capsid protein